MKFIQPQQNTKKQSTINWKMNWKRFWYLINTSLIAFVAKINWNWNSLIRSMWLQSILAKIFIGIGFGNQFARFWIILQLVKIDMFVKQRLSRERERSLFKFKFEKKCNRINGWNAFQSIQASEHLLYILFVFHIFIEWNFFYIFHDDKNWMAKWFSSPLNFVWFGLFNKYE